MNKFAFVDCVATVEEALGQLGDGATIKAGGIDLLDLMKDEIVSPPKLVNIRNISGLHGITAAQDGLHLGPLSTLTEIAAHPEIQKNYSALADAAGHAATPQVRNMATLGIHHAAPSLLVLPLHRLRLQEEERRQRRLSRPHRREPVPRRHEQRRLRHGSSLLHRRASARDERP